MRNKNLAILFFFCTHAMAAYSQLLATSKSAESKPLKRNFLGIQLGQSESVLKKQLSKRENSRQNLPIAEMPESYHYFLYDSYISEIDEGSKNSILVEVKGRKFIDKGLFQFSKSSSLTRKLIAITIILSQKWTSYEQLLQKLIKSYGNPSKLSPQRSIWEDDKTMISIEKDLRYKIIDKDHLSRAIQKNQDSSKETQLKYEEFLKQF